MKTIWKLALDMVPKQDVELPAGSQILCAREQDERVCIWFLCDPEAKKSPRTIALVGTGHAMPDPQGDAWRFLGTSSLTDGLLMLHAFELT